jgi:hypothetical protein
MPTNWRIGYPDSGSWKWCYTDISMKNSVEILILKLLTIWTRISTCVLGHNLQGEKITVSRFERCLLLAHLICPSLMKRVKTYLQFYKPTVPIITCELLSIHCSGHFPQPLIYISEGRSVSWITGPAASSMFPTQDHTMKGSEDVENRLQCPP